MTQDTMKVSVLASGSTGNATYIETPHHQVLIDAGLSGKKIEELMNSIGKTLADVDSLFVSHEHTDHSKGVGVLARRYGMDIYANEATWNAMSSKIGKIDVAQKHIFKANSVLSLGDLDIESFSVSHDAADPQFYEFHHNGHSFAIVTDTGYVSERVEGVIKNAEAYLLECNHDTEMLRMGPYPWQLKQRIMSDTGHLSNEDGARVMMDVLGNHTKQIFLGHLSKENNIKELAHLTVENMMKDKDFAVEHDFHLLDTSPNHASELIVL